MKRVSYREAVEIISLNDEPLETDPETIAGMISVSLIADIFDIPAEKVAKDILKFREKYIL